MDAVEVAHRRLHRQHLSGSPLPDCVAVVRHLGASQAQEVPMSRWSLGMRSGTDDATVLAAIDDGRIVRTHALRATWHYLAAEDLRWVQALTGPRVVQVNRSVERQVGIDDEAVARTHRAVTTALRGGEHLTRGELGDVLARAGVEASGLRLAYLLMRLELDAVIASGAVRGAQQTYALVDGRVAEGPDLRGDDALAELTRRFFTGHGPAAEKDMAWWATLTLTQVRRGIALCEGELVEDEVDGVRLWSAPGPVPARDPSPTAHVLQGYDEYGVAYTASRFVTNLAGLSIAPPGSNTVIAPLLVDGQVVGWWRRVVARDGVVAQPRPARALTDSERAAVETAFASYARFAGLPVRVDWDA
ncbi:winged helix DNA-binding domain-containing protein [Cellulomonas sp. H30R-01]|uniref:winged helix DNA-binding domain-containing protein n=1 Tax=Cellulomonas sp. H30R-01 TaxID=2704467 RepID=UPI00138C1A52|nr:winged helix DNA-binding domain-containing protein [Cellulomonas sp. H30R-01]QHT55211.1 winged helix DNA-binding domain-containing protein [Cellulomonas sp. H30R-01]